MNITSKLKSLLFPLGNCESVAIQICRLLKVPVTESSIKKQLEEHPDFPSLLSVSETLGNFGVESLATKISSDQIAKLAGPIIVQLEINREKYFSVVTNINGNGISYIDPITSKNLYVTTEEFSKSFTGYVLVVEASEHCGEKNYIKNQWEERRKTLARIVSAGIVPLITLICCILSFISNGVASAAAIVYTFVTLAGTIVGTLLLWYEIDQNNPALQEICSAGKKTNCSAILNSKASRIFGISWSVIGFTYFAGCLFVLLISNINQRPILSFLSWINVLTLPYIVYSLYYQYRIAKEWCTLCLTIQAILFLQFTVTLWGGFHSFDPLHDLTLNDSFNIGFSFIIPFLVVSLLLPALLIAKNTKRNKRELQKLKHNTQIFDALLIKQKSIEQPQGLGISIGNPEGKFKLVKVCNPYCGPCANAHPAIEELVSNNPEVHVQILFTASDDENDYKTPPVKHLLAIAERDNELLTKQALDDWYLAEVKSYDIFAKKYPMNGELKKQNEKIKAMNEWCKKTKIEFTPTFFVNGHQLPGMYTISDLKYFLSV